MHANIELEKCPFCRGEAEMLFVTFLGINIGYQVRCKKCHSSTAYCYSEERAAKVWNRCMEPPNTPLTPEELRNLALRKWVWIDVMDASKEHGAGSAYYRKSDCYNPEEVFSCGYPGWEIMFEYADYGKTWLAYRQKSKEETYEQNKN